MIFLDLSTDYQKLFQDPATPMMNGIIDLHHYVMFFLFVILIFVVFMLFSVVDLFIFLHRHRKLYLNQKVHPFFIRVARFDRKAYNYFFRKFQKAAKPNEKRWDSVVAKVAWNNMWAELLSVIAVETFTSDVLLSLTGISRFKLGKGRAKRIIGRRVCLVKNMCSDLAYFQYNVNLNCLNKAERSLFHNKSIYVASIFFTNREAKQSKYIYIEEIDAFIDNIVYPKAFNKTLINQIFPRPEAFRRVRRFTHRKLRGTFKSYALNSLYWIQTYLTLRSGINNFIHSTTIEIVWTLIPSLILVFIGIPSVILLYAMDEIIEPDFVVKCIGHQWYWSYEVEMIGPKVKRDFGSLDIESC
jgi:hypothetical protein